MRALLIAHMVAALAGAPANTAIRCDGAGSINGYAITSQGARPLMELTPLVCSYLHRWRSPFLLGIGVHLVAHESAHLRGIASEYAAESRTQRVMPHILRDLLPRLGYGHGARYRQALRSALQGSEGWHDVLPWRYKHP